MAGVLKKGPCFGQRHILALLINLAQAVQFTSRVSLSVVLVAMVSVPSDSKSKVATADSECTADTMLVANLSSNFNNISNETEDSRSIDGEFEWSRELQGVILSSFFWGYLILQIPAGTFAQRYGGKWLLGIGVIGPSLLNMLGPICAKASAYLFVGLLFLKGVLSSITPPAMVAMLGRWAPEQEAGGLMTISMSGIYLGTIIGQLCTGVICESETLGGWRTVFYINGMIGVIWFIAWSLLVTNSPEEHPKITSEELTYITQSLGSDQGIANRNGVPWLRMLLSRGVIGYIILSFALSWLSYTMLICFPQFISDVLHMDISADGDLASLPVITEFIFSNIVTQLADLAIQKQWFSKLTIRKMATTIGFWGCSLGFIAIKYVGCNITLVIMFLVIGYAQFGAVYGGFYTYPLDACPEYAGTVFAVGNVFGTVAGLSSPIAADFLTSEGGNRTTWMNVFYVSIAIGFAAGLFHIIFGAAEREKWHITEQNENEKKPLLKSIPEIHDYGSVPIV